MSGGNSEKWLTFLDPMMAKLTGNDFAEAHGQEIDTAAAASAAVLAAVFAPYAFGAIGAGAGAGAGAAAGAAEGAAAGLTASEIAALDAAGGYTLATGAVDGAAMGVGSGIGGASGMTAADIAYLDAMGGYTPATGASVSALDPYMVGATEGAQYGATGGAAFDPYMAGAAGPGEQLPALQGFGGGTASLFGSGAGTSVADPYLASTSMFGPEGGLSAGLLTPQMAQPTMAEIAAGANPNAAVSPSMWSQFADKGGKFLTNYAKTQAVLQPIKALAAPQSPQMPQPQPLSRQQARSQPQPVDWASYFGAGVSDEEIKRRYLAQLNGQAWG